MSLPDFDPVQKLESAPVHGDGSSPWGATWKVLTPQMRDFGGRLGVVQQTLKPGMVGCPFHWHSREDEVFFVLSGRGVLRYGESIQEISSGDCVSCPADTQVAHQIANPFDEDLVYLAIGAHDPHEVCGYPDSQKILVRAISQVGHLVEKQYLDDEPERPSIFEMWRENRENDE